MDLKTKFLSLYYYNNICLAIALLALSETGF